jgi:hypothetical protein
MPASSSRSALPAVLLVAAVAWLAPALARGGGLAGKEEEAVRTIFPAAERFAVKDVLLTNEMVERIERLSRTRVRERLVTFYTAQRGAEVLGHAVIHSHVVRTKRETLALAFEPDGRIRKIAVLAFLEPPEYRPSDRWLAQFVGKGHEDRLAVGQDIAPISGATLTARGVTEQSRWLLHALREAEGARP